MLILPVLFGSAAGAAALIMALIWLLALGWQRETWRALPRFQQVWLASGLGFFALFAITARTPHDLIYGFNTFAFVLAIGVFAFARRWLTPRHLIFLSSATFLGLLIGAGWAFYQHHQLGVPRTTAYVGGGSNLVARVALMLYFFSLLPLFMAKPLRWWWGVAALSFPAAMLIVIYSGSRGTLLVTPLMVMVPLIFTLPASAFKSARAYLVLSIVLALACSAAYYLDPNNLVSQALSRIQTVLDGEGMDSSTRLRFEMWQVAFAHLTEHPIVGTGWHSFVTATEGHELYTYAERAGFFNFHSDLGNFAVAGGMIGLLLYLFLLLAPLLFWQTPHAHPYFRVRLAWALSMPVLFLGLGLTDMVIGFDYPTMFYAFSFALVWGCTNRAKAVSLTKAEMQIDQGVTGKK
ncbi:O-antigen ligase family protein [Maritalea mediterranea]|uniref:O-antigen ligase family protein n=1 Tax=Maritalea mediterranea TaxID=2909667 RepID=A0ABS9E4X8_9HYPH|nr:O-antigen ligase family protein [Maritalea mediterranea]MCF4097314.1 O-antigen ligase family protein [Maritalea mediterranea]